MTERPPYPRPWDQMTFQERQGWCALHQKWLDERTRAGVDATGVNAGERRIDPMGRMKEPQPKKKRNRIRGVNPDKCHDCKNKPEPGRARCAECSEKMRLYHLRRRAA